MLTHDEPITGHITARHRESKGHAGVFNAGHHLQGEHGIGAIVISIREYHALKECEVVAQLMLAVGEIVRPVPDFFGGLSAGLIRACKKRGSREQGSRSS